MEKEELINSPPKENIPPIKTLFITNNLGESVEEI